MESVQLLNKLFSSTFALTLAHTWARVCIRQRVLPGAHLPRSIVLNFSYLLPKLLLFFFSKTFSNNCAHTHADTNSPNHLHTHNHFCYLGLLVDLLHIFCDGCANIHIAHITHIYNSHHDTPFDAFDIAIGNKLPMLNELETCKTVKKLNWRHIACMHLAPPPPPTSS